MRARSALRIPASGHPGGLPAMHISSFAFPKSYGGWSKTGSGKQLLPLLALSSLSFQMLSREEHAIRPPSCIFILAAFVNAAGN
ncbi:hypothetical protein EYF80_034436 [Liparis tanakae]|uniref:Uncharacterized protein n=1 Tax=Liparis tanakae TaxID=230148 RepID=A0A4Z2GRG1_9TELE|nr:hypothetical protein EYF80_034436 [Liparis tanakae]